MADADASEDCIFCSIVAGNAPCSPVYDDDRVLAFMDINPATSGHLLVVPKRHATHLADLDRTDGVALFATAQRLAGAARDALAAEGVNLFLADGEVAGQEVFHVHLHVLPRHQGDGFGVRAQFEHPERTLLDDQAARISAALG
jgi:histidine triad (HIT) family protein